MKQVLIAVFILLAFSAFTLLPAKRVSDFALRNVDGKLFSTLHQTNAKGYMVVFTCNHCPFAKLYSERLNALHQQFAPKGFPLLAINSMDSLLYEDETFSLMQEKAKHDQFSFPYLHDPTQQVGKLFGAEHTPMVFVLWKENQHWTIRYKGAIDDNGEHPELAQSFVAKAVNELLAGKPVTQPTTTSFGCRITYRK